jgi:hypothetical protein
MARKISGGTAGSSGLGGIQVTSTTLTAADNADITFDPSGTGIVKIAGDAQLQAQGDLRFADSDSSNWVAFQAPATISSNVTWTLPATDGSANQVLTTNSSGTLSWTTAAVTITDNTSDSGTNYIAFTTATTGTITAARVSTTGLTFTPSTGTIGATAANINGTVTALLTENSKSTDHTLALVDRNRVVNMNNAAAATVTIPLNSSVAFPTGSVVYINRTGAGSVTLAVAGGVTINKTGTLSTNEELYVRKRGENSWLVVDVPKNLSATGGAVGAGTGTASGYTVHQFTSGSSSFILG